MHPAYSVILFTTSSGAGYGLLALLGLTGMSHGAVSDFRFGAVSLLLGLGLVTVGLLSSTFHLGHPERAWRAFSQWRSSWLSREGVLAVLTFIPVLSFGALWLWPGASQSSIAFAGGVSALLCMVTVFSTAMIYASLPTVRAWQHWLVVPVYMIFSLATGAILLLALASLFGRSGIPALAVITVVSLIAAGLAKLVYWSAIDSMQPQYTMAQATGLGNTVRQWELPHTAENFVQKEMGYRVGRKHAQKLRSACVAGLIAAAALAWFATTIEQPVAAWITVISAILAIFSALIERWLFFAQAKHAVSLFYGETSV